MKVQRLSLSAHEQFSSESLMKKNTIEIDVAKAFVKSMKNSSFRRATFNTWADKHVPWAEDETLDSVWELVLDEIEKK